MKKLVLIVILLLVPPLKISADEILSPHTMGHILGGIGSFFLGPLPGIGLSVLPELLDSAESSSNNNDSDNSKTIFYVNEYSKEFQIEPYLRFESLPGEQMTMFFYDPSGNALEFKSFKNITSLSFLF